MEAFEFQKALKEKGVKIKDLPQALKDKKKEIDTLARELVNVPEGEPTDELDSKLDALDTELASEIRAFKPTEPAVETVEVINDDEPHTQEANSGGNVAMMIVVLVVIAVVIALAYKFLSKAQIIKN